MDHELLVNEKKDQGRILLSFLVSDGIDVTAAAWTKPTGNDRWQLYVVSATVDSDGLGGTYRKAHAAINRMGEPWIGSSDLKFISPSNPIAISILTILTYSNTV